MFDPGGRLLRVVSLYYGSEAPTNNTAEGTAMLDCVRLVDQLRWEHNWGGVVFKGDSSLIISFM